MKKLRVLSVVLVMFIMVMGVSTATFAKTMTLKPETTLWAPKKNPYNSGTRYLCKYKNIPSKAKLVSVKSSNEAVLTPDIYSLKGDGELYVKKAGKATVTTVYKVGGKEKKITSKFTVKKTPDPIKEITVNGVKINVKKYSSQTVKDGTHYYAEDNQCGVYSPSSRSQIISLTVNKGWKIKKITAGEDDKKGIVKNGETFKLPKNYSEYPVLYTLQNKKGDIYEYGFSYWKNMN